MAKEKKFVPDFRAYTPSDLSKNWFVYWYENGKRRRKYGRINTADTRRERLHLLKDLITKLEEEYQGNLTLSQSMVDYVNDQMKVLTVRSYESYRSKVRGLIRFLDGRPLTAENVQAFFAREYQRLHPTTYNASHQMIKQVLTGIGQGQLMAGIDKMKKAHSTPARYFQRHQIATLKRVISEEDPELWMYVQFIYYCFIRPNELRKIKAADVLLDMNKIRVPAKISKNRKEQYVTIPEGFRPEVSAFIKQRPPSGYLFPGRDARKPMGRNTMNKRHRGYLDLLGFGRGYSLYSWKHTGAVACVLAGVGVKELQVQLRHHSLEMVDKYLRQLGVEDLTRLEKLFPKL